MIDASPFERVIAYIDTAFAKHHDSRSHTGMVLTLGNTPFMFKSKKQKMITKSSTAAELVALNDMMQFTLTWTEFLQGQGIQCQPPLLLQDNESVLKIVASNGKILPNVHLRTKQADIRETVQRREMSLQHIGTKSMIADIFTKPLHGK